MRAYIEKFINIPQITDSDSRRRGRNLIVLSFIMIILDILLMGMWTVQGQSNSIVAGFVMLAILITTIIIVKHGYILIPSLFLIAMMILADFGVILGNGILSDAPFFLLLPIATSGAILPPRYIWAVLGIILLGFGSITLYIFQLNPPTNFDIMSATDAASLAIVLTAIVFLTGRNTVTALHEAQASHQQAEQLAQQLEHINIDLESQVSQRTAELSKALSNQEEQSRALQISLEQQQALNNTIKQLSLPIIPVRQDALVAPLIGILDEERAQHAIDTLLKQIERDRTRTLILDVTGVVMVDTQLAKTLLQIAQAARLLGTRTILVGIRPEVAQILVSLHTDLSHLQSAATLQEGLALS